MNLLQPYLSDTLVQALGWTFLHSLWIGALLCAVFLATKWVMRSNTAQVKYVAGLVFMTLMPLATVLAFVLTYGDIKNSQPVSGIMEYDTGVFEQLGGGVSADTYGETTNDSFLEDWLTTLRGYYFFRYHSVVVTIWLLGVLLLSVQHIGGYFYTGRLRNNGLLHPSPQLMDTFERLLSASGVERSVQMMESLLVKAPLLIGYFKPVILLPVGLAANLSASEVEAILAHEIAHIRRHDFLVNIMQRCVEVVFFYHPGIWIIGSIIRNERENCCDDVAISLTGSRLHLAMALTHVEEWKLSGNLALGFSGNKNSLLNRIKRIINNKTMKAQHREGNLLAIGIVAGLCLSTLTALKGIEYQQPKEAAESVETIEAIEPVTPEPTPVVATEPLALPAKEAVRSVASVPTVAALPDTVIQNEGSASAPVVVATPRHTPDMLPLAGMPPMPPVGAVLSADAPGMYSLVAPRAGWAHSVMPALSAGHVWALAAGIDTAVWEPVAPEDQELFAAQMEDMAREMARMQDQMAREMTERAMEMSRAAEQMAQQQQNMASEMARDQQKMAEEMAERHREMAEKHAQMAQEFSKKHHEEMMKHQEDMMKEQKKMMAIHEEEMKAMKEEMQKHEERMKSFQKDLRQELIKDGLIGAKDQHFKLRINKSELLINGSRQSGELLNKYKKFIREKLGNDQEFNSDRDEMNFSFSY